MLIKFRLTSKHDLYVTRDIVEIDEWFDVDRKGEMSGVFAARKKRCHCSTESRETSVLYDSSGISV